MTFFKKIRYYLKRVLIFFLQMLFNYVIWYLNILFNKIIVDSRANKKKIFLAMVLEPNFWYDIFILIPVIKTYHEYARKNNLAFVLCSTSQDILDYLYAKKMIDGYLKISEVFNSDVSLLNLNHCEFLLTHENVNERRTFHSIFSFSNFFWNNYKIVDNRIFGLPICNPYVFVLLKFSEVERLSFYVNVFYFSSIINRIFLFLNYNFFLLKIPNMISYKEMEVIFLNKIIKEIAPKSSYKPAIKFNSAWKALPYKDLSQFLSKKDKFVVFCTDETFYYKNWSHDKVFNLFKLLNEKFGFKVIVIYNQSDKNRGLKSHNYIQKFDFYSDAYNLSKIVYNFNKESLLFSQIGEIMRRSEFVISEDNYFSQFLVQIGLSGIIIAGNINAGFKFPYPKEHLNKNQKLIWMCEINEFLSYPTYYNKKINLLLLQKISVDDVINQCKKFIIIKE